MAGSWEGLDLIAWLVERCVVVSLGSRVPGSDEGARTGEVFFLLGAAPACALGEDSSTMWAPHRRGLVGERGERTEGTKDAKKVGVKREWSPKEGVERVERVTSNSIL